MLIWDQTEAAAEYQKTAETEKKMQEVKLLNNSERGEWDEEEKFH